MEGSTPKKQVILLARCLLHESSPTIEGRLFQIAKANALPEPYTVYRGRLDPIRIPQGAVLVVDHPARLGNNQQDVIRNLAELLAKDCRIIRGNDPACELHDLRRFKTLILFLAHLPKVFRATKIKNSLAMRRKNNLPLGRERINEEIRQAILEEFARTKTTRGTCRRLNERGIKTSRSTCFRVIASHKKKMGAA